MQVSVEVKQGDAFKIQADVLILKYAQQFWGLDAAVASRLSKFHKDFLASLPGVGESLLVESYGSLSAKTALFVGVKPLGQFDYQEIREFARRALAYLAQFAPNTKHVCLTIHGVGFGLDESEAFESEIAGLVDGIASGHFPRPLERITVIDRDSETVVRLNRALSLLLPDGAIRIDSGGLLTNITEVSSARLSAAGNPSESKPLIFVAMPFADKMDDVFHYGIRGAVNRAGFLCERADAASFTGDIMDWVKQRIRGAAFMIADLTTANPNVYLEVGYAWGCGIPTIFLVQDTAELKFDVRGQRCLAYKSILQLEESLAKELENLRSS
jgi:hypothetical protein